MPECPVDGTEVAIAGQLCSAECYSEWLATKLYETLDGPTDPFAEYTIPVPIKLRENEDPPLPLIMQPWYQDYLRR